MKVLYFISTLIHGKGGHTHSLNHISSEIGEHIDIGIISLGITNIDIFENNPYYLGHIPFYGFNIYSLQKKVNKFIEKFQPTVLHTFDYQSYMLLALLSYNKEIKIVCSKCGGPNPIDYPKCSDLILFSKENEEWFKSNPKFEKTNIYLIPNRVKRIHSDSSISLPGLSKDDTYFTFMRIARISMSYKKSIVDCINLIHRLKQENIHNVRLIVIGVIQDTNVYNELLKESEKVKNNVIFFTDKKETKEAARFLYISDAVIATGRGIMEAASLGKPILTPAKNSSLPVLVSNENFDGFFKTNFSQRNIANEYNLRDNLNDIKGIVSDKAIYNKYSQFSYEFFDDYFNVKKCTKHYLDVYEKSKYFIQGNFFTDWKFKVKVILSFFYRYLKTLI